MGRLNKVGIDYFPFDVDFFHDEKIEFISARFQTKGESILIRLLCKVYRNGYYTGWNTDESMLLAKRAGNNISPTLVSEVVRESVKRGFFDEAIFNQFGVLTSKGIQKRYVAATSERKTIVLNRDIWLIETPKNGTFEINRPINGINRPINPQSKVKESKEKENRKKEPQAAASAALAEREEDFRNSLIPHVEKYGREMIRAFFDYWSEPNQQRTKMRWELEKTWELLKRLRTWEARSKMQNSSHGNRTGGRLMTYNEMLNEVNSANPMSNYESVHVDGSAKPMWRRKA